MVEDSTWVNCFGQNSNTNALECKFAHMLSGKFESSVCLRAGADLAVRLTDA